MSDVKRGQDAQQPVNIPLLGCGILLSVFLLK